MAELTTVSFGPQHPVLPEPIHLDLELKDEKVVRAVPSIGYVHRGLEKLVEKRDFKQFIYVAERVCGICSFGHGWGYAKAVEGLMEIDVPRRASYLRTIWHELSRLHNHLLWLGLGADALGFESLLCTAGVFARRSWIFSKKRPAAASSSPSARWAACAVTSRMP